MPYAEGRVAPDILADGAVSEVRLDKTGSVVVSRGHGTYYEAASRGGVFTISTPLAGIIVTANMLTSVASSNTICGIYNPTNNYNFHIIRAVVVVPSNATATGVNWGTISTGAIINPVPTGVQRAKNSGSLVLGGHKARAFDGSVAVSGSGATDLFRQVAVGLINTPLSVVEADNDIIVGPGAFAGLFGDTTTTAAVVKASITWEEVLA